MPQLDLPNKWYCDVDGCYCNYPCPIHDKKPITTNGFKLLVTPPEIKPRQKKVDIMTVVNVVHLPCKHTYEVENKMLPEAHRKKKFNIECAECPAQYMMEVSVDFIEFTRIDENSQRP